MRYVALLRGVNVGGKNILSMKELVAAMHEDGFTNVKSYINSGNILFDAEGSEHLASRVSKTIKDHFDLDIEAVVVDHDSWQRIIKEAPKGWGKDPTQRHYLLVMLPPSQMSEIIRAIGPIKTDIESLTPGKDVLYQSASLKDLGRTVSNRIAGNPLYKRMTIRNANTVYKLAALLSTDE